MSESWAAVDHLLESFLLPQDEALSAALAAAEQAGLPPIQVPPVQGRFLHLLARSIGARRVLEFGTLGGYSTIWLARAIPADGRLTTLELNPAYAEVARANLERAGVGDRVDIVVDNVVRRGGILDESGAGDDAANVAGIRRVLSAAGSDPRVDVTALQTVGSKGHDGFALAVVN